VLNVKASAQDSALELALAYAESGYSPVPLLRHNKVPPKELGGWQKFKERQPTTEEIKKWFQGRDDLVVALICGKFIVVDADTPEASTGRKPIYRILLVKLQRVKVCTTTTTTQKTLRLG